MLDTVLEQVKAQIKTLIAGMVLSHPGETDPFFAHVYEEGDAIDETALPIAVVHYGPERVLETTSKTMCSVPWFLEFAFDVPAGSTPAKRAAEILGDLKKTVMDGRTLGGLAIDSRYQGEATEVIPLGDENSPAYWMSVAAYETDYRYLTTDPATSA